MRNRSSRPSGFKRVKGDIGNGIASIVDNDDGTFTYTFIDGTEFTTSDLTGPQGVGGITIAGYGISVSGRGISDDEYEISFTPTSTTLSEILTKGNTVNGQLKSVSNPTDAQDAATKTYVDALEAKLTVLENRIKALEPAGIGDLIAGGIVFYIAPTPTDLDGDGILDLGLVCALNDYSTNVVWGCYGTDLASVPNVSVSNGVAVGLGAEIGYGMANTNGMLNDCPSSPAALAARSMGTEWFLPSAAELNEIFEQQSILEGVTGFSALLKANYYWTSSEDGSLRGIRLHSISTSIFDDTAYKVASYRVRSIRVFH